MGICINMQKKSGCLIDLFWRYGWFKNPTIWLAENILAITYLRNKNFPKYGICAETQQIIYVFIIEQIKYKLKTNFFNKFKKPSLWTIFDPFSQFWGKISPRKI